MKDFVLATLWTAREIEADAYELFRPSVDGEKSKSYLVVDVTLVRNTRKYIELTVNQINGCYEHGWYDACAVMLRKLIETLIIETFEARGIESKIKDKAGDYFYLEELINKTISEPSFHLGRNCKQGLRALKRLGDQSAHSRRFSAKRNDIESRLDDIRTVVQELIYLIGWR